MAAFGIRFFSGGAPIEVAADDLSGVDVPCSFGSGSCAITGTAALLEG